VSERIGSQPGTGSAGAASRSSAYLFTPILIPPSRPALEPGRTSWMLPLDAVRPGPTTRVAW
jgi:hypothetical protein